MDASQNDHATSAPGFRCDVCDKSFSGRWEFNRHNAENKAHRLASNIRFPGCAINYQRPSDIRNHFVDKHVDLLCRVTISKSPNSTNGLRIVSFSEQGISGHRVHNGVSPQQNNIC
jgi:hypothetical protein